MIWASRSWEARRLGGAAKILSEFIACIVDGLVVPKGFVCSAGGHLTIRGSLFVGKVLFCTGDLALEDLLNEALL
jgi:hypothetical protein